MSDAFPVIPGYRILKQMGQGGMATVYLAIQESFGREVALKIMSDQLGKDDIWARRFMHEARIVAQLSHSNIVPVFDVGSHDGRFYISMELLKGEKLDDRMARGMAIPEIVRIICGVAAGLDYAGSKGFVHRDIKPDNIMFRDDGTPVILDFGIAKQKDGDNKMTKTGTIVGTTAYMSPEQAMGQELDERSDIYSLGIMFYELLTGAMPFNGETSVVILLKHVQEPPPPLPVNLAAFQPVMDKALAKKPQDRYQRASEMAEHLQELLPAYKQQATSAQAGINAGTATTVMSAPTTVMAAAGVDNKTVLKQAPVAPASNTTPPEKKNKLMLPIAIAVIVLLVVLGGVAKRMHKSPAETVTEQPAVTAPASPVTIAPPANETPATTPAPATATTPPAPETSSPAPSPAPEAPAQPVVSKKAAAPVPSVSPAPVTSPEPVVHERPKVAQESIRPHAAPAPSADSEVNSPVNEGNGESRRAIARILMGAHECMKNRQYDCAKSKAEAALDLDPDNEIAKQILANAKKAQQEAFGSDWEAK